jgi:hypothetical protein
MEELLDASVSPATLVVDHGLPTADATFVLYHQAAAFLRSGLVAGARGTDTGSVPDDVGRIVWVSCASRPAAHHVTILRRMVRVGGGWQGAARLARAASRAGCLQTPE